MSDIDDLSRMLGEDPRLAQKLGLRQGVVSALTGNAFSYTYSVRIGGTDTVIPGVKALENVCPLVGDTVWILQNGPDVLIVGRTKSRVANIVAGKPGQPYISGGSPYVDVTLSNFRAYKLGPELYHLHCAQFLTPAAPSSQRIAFSRFPTPVHSTVAYRIPTCIGWGNSGMFGLVWSPSELIWFLADSNGAQVSGGWPFNHLFMMDLTSPFVDFM